MFTHEITDLLSRASFCPDGDGLRHCQNIIAALRGPDFTLDLREIVFMPAVSNQHDFLTVVRDNECWRAKPNEKLLKWYTTARIRFIVTPSYCGAVNHTPLTIGERELAHILLRHGTAHFQEHYDTACVAIRTLYNWDLLKEKPFNASHN